MKKISWDEYKSVVRRRVVSWNELLISDISKQKKVLESLKKTLEVAETNIDRISKIQLKETSENLRRRHGIELTALKNLLKRNREEIEKKLSKSMRGESLDFRSETLIKFFEFVLKDLKPVKKMINDILEKTKDENVRKELIEFKDYFGKNIDRKRRKMPKNTYDTWGGLTEHTPTWKKN